MSDLVNLLPSQPPEPPKFDEAVRGAVARLQGSLQQFEALLEAVPQEAYTPEEWAVIERAATDVEVSAEMADEGYVAVQYDGHAWYRIMEHLERVANRLDSALGIMRAVQARAK